MRYKILLLLSILFIISLSAVSAENVDNQTLEQIDDSIDIDNNTLSDDDLMEAEEGTFNQLEKILWNALDGDTITLDRNYSYDGGDRKVMGVYRQITIDGAGYTLDGKNGARIFYVGSEVKNLTLMNINFVNSKIDGSGGAILNDGAELTITNCNFTNNRITGTSGGAIASNNANNIVITDCKFSGNYATGVGGAVSINGNNAEIINCIFTNNEARDNLGGAVLIYGNYANIRNNTFTNNKAGRDGGAIDIEGKTESVKCVGTVIINNTFTGNSAPFGGAVGLNGNDATISNNIFKSNNAVNSKSYDYAGIGGAMRLIGAKNINVINNTFTGNTAYRQGGAFYLEGTNSVISKNRLTNNHATIDAGGAMNVNGNGITVSENTITSSSSKNAGGAIFINGNNLKIIDNKISQTKSTNSYGGAIQLRGDGATISGNEFTQTTAKGNGGAIFANGKNTKITNNIITKCISNENGGGAYLSGSGSVLSNAITSCSATYFGGGICFKGTEYALNGNTFRGNTADKGSDYYPTDMPSGKISTILTATDVTTTYGTVKYVIATLKDEKGNPISGAKIGFSNNGMTYVSTDASGKARYYTNGLLPGSYTVNIKFYGDDNYDASNKAVSKVVINKVATKLSVTNLQAPYKSNKYILAVLTDANGKAINNAKIAFATPNGMKYINTGADGKARYYINELEEGSYNINVKFYGNDTYSESAKATSKVVISKIATKLSVTSVSTTPNSGKYILAVLTDANGKAISGAKIGFATPNGMKYVVTDANGKARLSVNDFALGSYDVKVAYYGNDTYQASNKATSKVVISKVSTKLGVTSVTAKYKSNKYILAVLTDANGKAINNAKIAFATPNGMKYVNTGADGKARLSIADFAVGSYNVKVAYYGDATYQASNQATSKITITK